MLTQTGRQYLLEIYEQCREGCAARSVDIARVLGVSRASVSKKAKELAAKGYIQKAHYGNIHLTELGIAEANRMYTYYTLLTEFFIRKLQMDPQQARLDAKATLYALSEECMERCAQAVLGESGHSKT